MSQRTDHQRARRKDATVSDSFLRYSISRDHRFMPIYRKDGSRVVGSVIDGYFPMMLKRDSERGLMRTGVRRTRNGSGDARGATPKVAQSNHHVGLRQTLERAPSRSHPELAACGSHRDNVLANSV